MYPPAPVAPAPRPVAPPTPEPSVLVRVGTAGWRLFVAAFAFWGVYLVAYDPLIGWTTLEFLSQSGSLVAALLYALMIPVALIPGGSKAEPAVAWVRGALASMMMLICISSLFILDGGGDLDQTGFLLEHLLTPLVIAADYVLVGRFSARTKAWHPATWMGLPLVYLIWVNLTGASQMVYGGILSPASPEFFMYFLIFLATAAIFGYILFGLAKLRGLIFANMQGAAPVAQQQQQWPQQQPMAPGYGQAPYPQPTGMAPAAPPPPQGAVYGSPQQQHPQAPYQQPTAGTYQQPPVPPPGG